MIDSKEACSLLRGIEKQNLKVKAKLVLIVQFNVLFYHTRGNVAHKVHRYDHLFVASKLVSNVEGFMPDVRGSSPREVFGSDCLCPTLEPDISDRAYAAFTKKRRIFMSVYNYARLILPLASTRIKHMTVVLVVAIRNNLLSKTEILKKRPLLRVRAL